MKVKSCKKCGCDRVYLMEGKLILNDEGSSVTFRTLCIGCMLETIGININRSMDKESRRKILSVCKEE